MKKLIQATTKDNEIHIFNYSKVSIAILEQLKNHYEKIVVLESNNNVIFKVVSNLFEENKRK